VSLVDRIREFERWVWRKSEKEPVWNVITWVGHAGFTALCVGIAAIPLHWGFDVRGYGAAGAVGYYLIREVVSVYRAKPVPETWPKYWRVLDPVMDVVAPLSMGFWLA
jgi:hypothetical protein